MQNCPFTFYANQGLKYGIGVKLQFSPQMAQIFTDFFCGVLCNLWRKINP